MSEYEDKTQAEEIAEIYQTHMVELLDKLDAAEQELTRFKCSMSDAIASLLGHRDAALVRAENAEVQVRVLNKQRLEYLRALEDEQDEHTCLRCGKALEGESGDE